MRRMAGFHQSVFRPADAAGPATVLMGCSFPILQKLAQTDLDYVGRRVGILLAANIAGSTIGAFVTGWIFLDRLGTAGTLRLLVVLSGVVAAAAAWWWTGTAAGSGRSHTVPSSPLRRVWQRSCQTAGTCGRPCTVRS